MYSSEKFQAVKTRHAMHTHGRVARCGKHESPVHTLAMQYKLVNCPMCLEILGAFRSRAKRESDGVVNGY